jgi:hypothetical protein
MKNIKLILIGLSSVASFTAFAGTPQSMDDSSITLKVQTDSKVNPYDAVHANKDSDKNTGLKFKSGTTSVQLYGTVDIGYEHWSGN